MSSVLSDKHFYDEAAAYRFVEARVWPDGPICPHCGGVERIGKMGGSSTRIGTYKCYQCRKPFTVKVGTIFESSHIPLHMWLQAIFLMASSKKGISSNQLHRTLGVTLKTAWFLSHRIHEAMRSGGLDPLGGAGKVVEADETYFGERENFIPSSQRAGRPYKRSKRGVGDKRAVLGLVERGGEARTFHVDRATKAAVTKIVTDNVDRETYLHTDESRLYGDADQIGSEHHTVKHSVGEYVRGSVHTNTVEGVFSVFKRGIVRRLPALLREAPPPLPRRVRFQVQCPPSAWCERRGAGRAGAEGYRGQASHLPNDWLKGPHWYGRTAEAKA